MTIGFADFVGFLAREMTKGVTAGTALRRAVIHFLPRGPADRPDQGLAVLLSLIQAEMLKGKKPCQALRVAIEKLDWQIRDGAKRQTRACIRGRNEEHKIARDRLPDNLLDDLDEEIPF